VPAVAHPSKKIQVGTVAEPTSACHAGIDPASRSVKLWKSNGFPFDCAQGGESFDVAQDREPVERPVEPRIKPGMTIN